MTPTLRFILKTSRHIIFALSICLFTVIFSHVVSAQHIGAINENTVNIRTTPSTSGTVLEKAQKGKAVTIVAVKDGWFEILVDNNTKAYVSSDYVTPVQVQAVSTVSGVNIRKEPNTNSEILGKLSAGDKILISGKSGDFFRFVYKTVTAYVHKDYVASELLEYVQNAADTDALVSSPDVKNVVIASPATNQQTTTASNTNSTNETDLYAIIDSYNGLNLRERATTESTVLTSIPFGEVATVLKVENIWLYVEFNGSMGYIHSDYVNLFRGDKPTPLNHAVTESPSGLASEVITYAMQFLGTRYKYGGTDLKNGVDCSGFTYSVFKHFGINLYRTSSDQIKNGVKVSKNELAVGDLVFFDTSGPNNGAISHVGIYIGSNKFIHSSSSSTYAVMISSLTEDYYIRTYVGACRVIK